MKDSLPPTSSHAPSGNESVWKRKSLPENHVQGAFHLSPVGQNSIADTPHGFPAPDSKGQAWLNGQVSSAQLKSNPAPVQFAHPRRKDGDKEQQVQRKAVSGVIQRVVADDVAANTQIIIDNPQASDFGDTGIVKRHSSVVAECQAVEFDNEKGTEYRVLNYEMSPFNVYDAGTTTFTMQAVSPAGGVTIVGKFSLGDSTSQVLDFDAIYKGTKIGVLQLAYYGAGNFYLTHIHTAGDEIPEDKRIPGMGVALLNIAAQMAAKLKMKIIELGATKFTKTPHPAPFYKRFGFNTVESLQQYDNDIMKLIEARKNQPVNMQASPESLSKSTDDYLTGKWSFGSWQNG